ncbi:MAG: methylenetetrahydrofolate reductase [Chitinophagaceae bacterium]
MKVRDYIKHAQNTLLSFEILPPLKGKGIESLFKEIEKLKALNPSFINVTYHRRESQLIKDTMGNEKIVEFAKRPGTVGICAAIKYKYNIEPVVHLICAGFSKEETEEALIELSYLDIENILALQGDAKKSDNGKFFPKEGGHAYASELVTQIQNMNQGIYLGEHITPQYPTNFCIGVAGYPEKHFEAMDTISDLQYLKQKVEQGASYIVTQMFFDNSKYFDFVKRCRAIGITIPIIPGLKPITFKKQIEILPKIFYLHIPQALHNAIMECTDEEACKQVGKEWLIQQSKELKKHGVPVLHYYTLSATNTIIEVVNQVM